MGNLKEIKTSEATVILVHRNLVKILVNENADLGATEIYEINEAKFKLVGENYHGVLFIPPKYGSMGHEGRIASASPQVNKLALGKAIIVTNLAQRLVTNFFIRFNKPSAPTKIFSNEEDGIKWLEQKIKKHFGK